MAAIESLAAMNKKQNDDSNTLGENSHCVREIYFLFFNNKQALLEDRLLF